MRVAVYHESNAPLDQQALSANLYFLDQADGQLGVRLQELRGDQSHKVQMLEVALKDRMGVQSTSQTWYGGAAISNVRFSVRDLAQLLAGDDPARAGENAAARVADYLNVVTEVLS